MGQARAEKGVLTISLDFELYWGMRDHRSLEEYRANLLGVREAVPRMLELFERHGVHATWATVGFLFCGTKDELVSHLPAERPRYANGRLDPYRHMESIGASEEEDPYHYAPSLLRKILACPGQEVGTHTMSHYYCLEPGQTLKAFRADLQAAARVAEEHGVRVTSLVFPRNQFNEEYVSACRDAGITAYRGNQESWVYEPRDEGRESLLRRGVRLLDDYVNITGHHGHGLARIRRGAPHDVPASRFLRPYSAKLRLLEPLRKKRIRDDMTHAATRGLVYHLWWHPHNFGTNTDVNIAFLADLLRHYDALRAGHGMRSLNMGEVVREIDG